MFEQGQYIQDSYICVQAVHFQPTSVFIITSSLLFSNWIGLTDNKLPFEINPKFKMTTFYSCHETYLLFHFWFGGHVKSVHDHTPTVGSTPD